MEKDEKLCAFYSRELIFLLEKYKYIRFISLLFREIEDAEKLRTLEKKLQKLMITKEDDLEILNKIFFKLYCISTSNLIDCLQVCIKGVNIANSEDVIKYKK